MDESTSRSPVVQRWDERISPGRFDGRSVIVTGAGSGIGMATALRIAREGGRVIANDVRVERLDALVAEHAGLSIDAVAGSIVEEQVTRRIVAAAGDRIDGLANVAGIMDDFTPVHEVSDEVWEQVLAVNLTGLMRLTRVVVPRMLAAGSGSIVNVSSEASFRGSAAGVAYTTSKHAVNGLTRSCAVMYGQLGIRTNAVAPGATATNIEAHWESELARDRLGPLMQANVNVQAQASQVAASITFLLSNDGTNINGAVLPSDGGWGAI